MDINHLSQYTRPEAASDRQFETLDVVLEGLSRGQPLRLSFHGARQLLPWVQPYFAAVAFDGSPSVRAASTAVDVDVSITVADGAPAHRHDADLISPLRVHLIVDLHGSGARSRPSERERRRHAQRVARHGYGYRLSRDDDDFDNFYDRMHVPTMAMRHGDRARSVDREEARHELLHRGALLLVTAEGVDVAGVLCQFAGDTCNPRLVGWLDADPIHLKREALKSVNHFLMEWARETGFRQVDFQGCEPFLRKGTFQSKRHLGTRLVVPDNELGQAHIRIRAQHDRPVVRDLLVANPVIGWESDGGLRPVFCADRLRPPLALDYACGGLGPARLVDLDETLAGRA